MNKIHIKPENKGKFNATKKRTGKTTEELTHSKNPITKKRAIFAQNAAKWNHSGTPSHAFGLENLDFASLAGAGIPVLGSIGGNSEVAQGLTSVAQGALTGSTFGPVGTAVGAGVGLIKGITGIGKSRKAERAAQEARERQQQIRNYATLGAISNEMASDYELQNPIIPTFNLGGTTNDNLAYVDNNETIVYPNGTSKKVVDKSGKTDNVLTKLPNGTDIYSDDMKIDGTNVSYAEVARKLNKISNRKYKNSDKFAETSRKLNESYVDREMNKLKINQFFKRSQMSKSTNNAIPKFALGYEDDPYKYVDPSKTTNGITADGAPYVETNYTSNRTLPSLATSGINANLTINPNVRQPLTRPAGLDTYFENAFSVPTESNTLSTGNGNSLTNRVQNVLTDYLSLSPYRYNVSEGNKPYEIVPTTTNPNAGAINRAMRARRISMEPQRQALNRQRAISRYNVRDMAGTGQNMAYNLASEVMLNRQEADLINQQQQLNNQYSAEYANTMNDLGKQWVNSTMYAEDATARNKAARDAYKATASTQLGQWAQNRALMNNQASRDAGLLSALAPYLKEGYDSNTLQNILKQFQ